MLGNLEPTVREALMKILSAIYETGMVEEVDLGLVLQLFGLPHDPNAPYMSFRDPGWVQEYMKFKKMIPDDANVTVINLEEDDPFAENIKEHLKSIGIDVDEVEEEARKFFEEHKSDQDSFSDKGPGPDEKIH